MLEHIVGGAEAGAADLGFALKLSASERSRLGKLLKAYDGRHIGGHRFTITGKGHARRFAGLHALAPAGASAQPGQVDFRPRFVEEDQPGRVEAGLLRLPGGARGGDVRPLLLAGVHDFF